MSPYVTVFSDFLLFCVASFWPMFTCNMAMESYGYVDHAFFKHFVKSEKIKALEQKYFFLDKLSISLH